MMNRIALIKIQKKCFILALLGLPFLTIRLEPLSYVYYYFINDFFLDKLSAFIFPVGMVFALITQAIYGSFFVRWRKALSYFVICWLLVCISEALAIYNFDLSQLIYYQHEFAFIFSEFLKTFGLAVTPYFTKCFSYWCDMVYNSATYLLWTYGVAYWIYCLYYKNSKELIHTCFSAGMFCFSYIFLYGCIETCSFYGVEWATDVLKTCNPYFYPIAYSYNNWPPLLMLGKIHRMRTIFAEPSYMGIYFAFLMPFIWYGLFKATDKYKKVWLLPVFISFLMMFLTRSRTAYGITLVQLCITIAIFWWLKRKDYYSDLKKILGCCFIAGILANSVTGINITGIDNLENGSNNVRWGYTVATAKIGLAHPIFGTGSELFNYYVEEYAPDFTKDTKNFRLWVDYFNRDGLRSAYPQMCEYSTRFAQNGIIGLGIILLPLTLALYKLRKCLKKRRESFLILAITTISLLGMATTGFSNHFNISYCYWVILGVAYVCVHDDGINEINTSEHL
jgi:hypothetical protein